MEGVVASFRGSRRTRNMKHIIIAVDSVNSKEKAETLIGKSVSWQSPAKKILSGKIVAVHGRNGRVRAIFESGLPGQALGNKIVIAQ